MLGLRFKNQHLWFVLGLSFVFLISRLINLTIMPVFVDEAIYTRWSQVILNDSSQFFIPLSDGKQPLFMWLGAISLKFISDPLAATRLISVLAGLANLWLVWLLSRELFNRQVALAASLVYLTCPFLFFYNRLAVADGLLTTFFTGIAWLAIRTIKRPNLLNSLLLGLCLGGGLLTKSTAAIAIFFLPLSLLFYPKAKFKLKLLIWLGLCFGGGIILAGLLYSTLRLSPLYYLIGQRTGDFIFTPKEVLSHPIDPFIFRFKDVGGWLIGYLTWPIFIFSVGSLIYLLIKNTRRGLFLAGWLIGPLLIEMEIAKGFTPRYFIFIAPFGVILAGYLIGLFLEKFKLWRVVLVTTLFIPSLIFDFLLLFNPPAAPIPIKEKSGYLEEWSAGYGIVEVSQYLHSQAKSGLPITVGTEGTQGYGTLPDGLEIYLRDVKNVAVVGMGQRAAIYTVPTDLIKDATIHPAYLVVNTSRLFNKLDRHLKFIASYPKANGGDPLLFYEVVAD